MLKNEFAEYLRKVFLKNLNFIVGAGILVLCYYAYSDISVRNSVDAAYLRSIPIALLVVILLSNLIFPKKFFGFKNILYILAHISLQLMMYGICIVHLHTEALAPSVTGAILVVFLISLDIKQNNTVAALIYGIPIVVFTLLLVFVGQPSSKEFFVMADIYPIVIVGFAINRTQYKLRFKLFRSNHLLNLEQDKTKALYNETLQVNQQLKKKASEAVMIKEEMQEKNEELNKSNATKDKFLGIIAHDLKNPIGAIWGLSDLLLIDDGIEEDRKNMCIKEINSSIKRTYGLLENLLTWARAQNKAVTFKPTAFNVFEIVERELQILKQAADEKNIFVENRISSETRVYADLNMFETVVRNLVSNAIKYTGNEGVVAIEAEVLTNGDSEYTQVSVVDDGVGMDEEKISKLFVLGNDVSTKGTNNERGTGLGLLLCKEFVDRHNGTIEVESELNKGSVFRCSFPQLN